MASWPGQRTYGDDRVFAVGTNAKRWRARYSGAYSLVAGQAKWRFRLIMTNSGMTRRRFFQASLPVFAGLRALAGTVEPDVRPEADVEVEGTESPERITVEDRADKAVFSNGLVT